MLDELSQRIWSHAEFQHDYRTLLEANTKLALGFPGDEIIFPDELAVTRLLQSAVHFAGTYNPEFRQAAYEIGVAAWNCSPSGAKELASVLECIFSRLGNFAASAHLQSRQDGYDSVADLPLGIWFEAEAHRETNLVPLSQGKSLLLTDFQRDLWNTLSNKKPTAVVAPTSAGKSYALQHFVALSVASSPSAAAVYIVPTRALITQVASSLEQILYEVGIPKSIVSTVPVPPEDVEEKRLLYVLTQERLQILLDAAPSLGFSLIAVDEAHLIGDEARGVLLQSVIERALDRSQAPQLLFISPLISNPEIFQKVFDLEVLQQSVSNEPSVSQHLVFVDRGSQDNEFIIRAALGGKVETIGSQFLSAPLFDSSEMLSNLSWHFGRNQQNLVYSGGPAACEDIARRISDLEAEAYAREDKQGATPALRDFAQFLRVHIHPQFLLAQTIEQGVAFHYGNMPSVVRTGVEDLFADGEIHFLVCTSTLLHGVNFPARNLFLLNPTRGRDRDTREDTPISPADFWNLAGRAGRMGKEFEGYVYLLDHKNWLQDPTHGERKQEIQPALYSAIGERREELVEFIRDEEHRSGADPELESTFSKLFGVYESGRLDQVLSKVEEPLTSQELNEIRTAIKQVSTRISLPVEVIEKNPTVSPIRQQALYEHFFHVVRGNKGKELLPVHPLSRVRDPYLGLSEVFKNIHMHLEGRSAEDRSHTYYATMALRWMRGESMARIIDDAHKRRMKQRKSKTREPAIGTTIREVFGLIEKDLRFRYVKFTKCYSDLLSFAFRSVGQVELVEQIPPLPLFLELGASSQTMVSLISIGLSRTTAGIMSALAPRQSMDRPEVLQWLGRQNLQALGLPNLCIREIQRVWSFRYVA
ncbi:DEAD/DEAH box helicase [Archangium violaceum]|uniref:DEAD/DEAH box helicase n=1 Tax=Archangium violaceum TaxID=83451 RepID=UPI000A015B8C|nr:DEAD/DEAH box helicase [Archangium violaceum]